MGYEVRGVFLDISKAFEKVWHEGLIFKLKLNDVSRKNAKHFIRLPKGSFLHKQMSKQAFHKQGSILGPSLFLIYINESSDPTSNPKFFANGTSIFAAVEDITFTVNEMNED